MSAAIQLHTSSLEFAVLRYRPVFQFLLMLLEEHSLAEQYTSVVYLLPVFPCRVDAALSSTELLLASHCHERLVIEIHKQHNRHTVAQFFLEMSGANKHT